MTIHIRRGILSLAGTIFLAGALLVTPVRAAAPDISIALDQPTTVIGRTVTLFIQIVNLEPHPILPTHFDCIADGTSLSALSGMQLPGVIAPNGSFIREQSYSAVSAGITRIHCELTAIDTETGAQIVEVSPTETGQVLSETRLAFDASSSSHVVQVGDVVTITASYANHGEVAFTDVTVSCAEAGRSLVFMGSTSAQTTLLPGESGSIESSWRAVTLGVAPIFCSITATDSSTGEQVIIPAAPLKIRVQ